MSEFAEFPVIAITQGDINGIGYEIILKTFNDPRMVEMASYVIYGSPKVLAYHKKALNLLNININTIRTLDEVGNKRPSILNLIDEAIRVELGKSTIAAGEASFAVLKKVADDLKNKLIDIVVTAPINKHNIQEAGFTFPGHTEFFASQFGITNELMLMVYNNLRIGVVTGHIPVSKVSETLNTNLIVAKLTALNQSLFTDFAIRKPNIAVLGLNPHAGDGGVIGTEEQEIILPAIEQARKQGIMAIGPFAADGFFGSGEYTKFDAILAMYHDQGLVPFKTIAAGEGVNFTAGLPIIRTSPAHGTAYDIAGKGVASEESFRQAIYLAIDIFRNRKLIEGIEPLKKQVYLETEER